MRFDYLGGPRRFSANLREENSSNHDLDHIFFNSLLISFLVEGITYAKSF